MSLHYYAILRFSIRPPLPPPPPPLPSPLLLPSLPPPHLFRSMALHISKAQFYISLQNIQFHSPLIALVSQCFFVPLYHRP